MLYFNGYAIIIIMVTVYCITCIIHDIGKRNSISKSSK